MFTRPVKCRIIRGYRKSLTQLLNKCHSDPKKPSNSRSTLSSGRSSVMQKFSKSEPSRMKMLVRSHNRELSITTRGSICGLITAAPSLATITKCSATLRRRARCRQLSRLERNPVVYRLPIDVTSQMMMIRTRQLSSGFCGKAKSISHVRHRNCTSRCRMRQSTGPSISLN